ncbi:MAG TPA: UTP--glucose-1-phosphate uridylyltransferase GalU [Burkholderiales bacterium]|nr:UTP--glucose-1-phosphate uridylyltransferase GalU [Burkholderiales bacterium]
MEKVTKAVFPVAGLGTRFLPATKASPKEMLPIVDKPLIQHAVEEALAAGIRQMVFVTGRNKRAIEDHFDKAYELEAELEAAGKHQLLAAVRDMMPPDVSFAFVRQPEALGLGHAVLCARPLVGDQPFAVFLADDLIDSTPPCMKQMVETYERERVSVIAVQEVPPEETRSYGVIKPRFSNGGGLHEIEAIVEKPAPAVAPSNLAVVGRYILSGSIFEHLTRVRAGAGGEIQLTDAIASLLTEERVVATELTGRRYDCGSKLGYLEATITYALRHHEVGEAFRAYLESGAWRDAAKPGPG